MGASSARRASSSLPPSSGLGRAVVRPPFASRGRRARTATSRARVCEPVVAQLAEGLCGRSRAALAAATSSLSASSCAVRRQRARAPHDPEAAGVRYASVPPRTTAIGLVDEPCGQKGLGADGREVGRRLPEPLVLDAPPAVEDPEGPPARSPRAYAISPRFSSRPQRFDASGPPSSSVSTACHGVPLGVVEPSPHHLEPTQVDEGFAPPRRSITYGPEPFQRRARAVSDTPHRWPTLEHQRIVRPAALRAIGVATELDGPVELGQAPARVTSERRA